MKMRIKKIKDYIVHMVKFKPPLNLEEE